MKKKIVLFQPYLRKHILNFGKYLKNFEFVINKPTSGNFYKTQLPSTFEKEVLRIKTSRINKIRRFLGLLNVRIKFDRQADMFFTYGCMLLTNKPYYIYVENGVAIYNYDLRIATHPISQMLFSFLIRRKNCKKLIFMSQAGQKSFYTSVNYSKKTLAIIKEKSVQIYPLIEKKDIASKNFSRNLKLLFVGMFYIKGGMELTQAFEKIQKNHKDTSLTIITPLNTIKKSDQAYLRSLPGLTLLDADFNDQQMEKFYRSHDLFVLPTYRDGFGLVLVEAISWGMPIICTDQYATTEVAINNFNAFVYPNHPLKDYDTENFTLLGKYYNPRDFYKDLFCYQRKGTLQPVIDFLTISIKRFIDEPGLLEMYSKNSSSLYQEKFNAQKISDQIESIFSEAIKKT